MFRGTTVSIAKIQVLYSSTVLNAFKAFYATLPKRKSEFGVVVLLELQPPRKVYILDIDPKNAVCIKLTDCSKQWEDKFVW